MQLETWVHGEVRASITIGTVHDDLLTSPLDVLLVRAPDSSNQAAIRTSSSRLGASLPCCEAASCSLGLCPDPCPYRLDGPRPGTRAGDSEAHRSVCRSTLWPSKALVLNLLSSSWAKNDPR